MRKLFVAVAAVLLLTGLAAASDQNDVMDKVNQFVTGFNKADFKMAAGACANETFIIDDFPPHQWQGMGACSAWASDYEADAKKNGITDGFVTIGQPKHVNVEGDVAYVVVPASFSFKQKGKTVNEAGSTFTLVLKKRSAGWRITAWAWGAN